MSEWSNTPTRMPDRDWKQAMSRGFRNRCPNCGEGQMFARFLKATPACTSCDTDLSVHRADDMPPYVTIMIVGHIVVPLILAVEMNSDWPMWWHMVLWPILTVTLGLLFMQPVKGALIAYQWALRMHGFDPAGDIHEIPASASPRGGMPG
jgi:uncharacterized protein (DUF983 family)